MINDEEVKRLQIKLNKFVHYIESEDDLDSLDTLTITRLIDHWQATRDLEEAIKEYLKYLDSQLSLQCWSDRDDGMKSGHEDSKNRFITIFKLALPPIPDNRESE